MRLSKATEKGKSGATLARKAYGSPTAETAGLPVWYERVEDTMRISGNEVKKVVGRKALMDEIQKMDLPLEPSPRPEDGPLIKRVTQSVVEMDDRDEVVADLKAQIEAGTYNPTGDEIADAMIRRAVADRTE